ncbi:unnamed protein product, partial [Ixodes hexagonus]
PVTKYQAVQQIPAPHHPPVYQNVPVSKVLPPVAHHVPVSHLHQVPAAVHLLPSVDRLPQPRLAAPLLVHQVPHAKARLHPFPYAPASAHQAPFAGVAPSPVFLQKIPVAKYAAPVVPYAPPAKFSAPLAHPVQVARPLGPGLVYGVPAPNQVVTSSFVQRSLVFKHAVPFLPPVKLVVPHLEAVPAQHFVPTVKLQDPAVYKKASGRSWVPAYTPESVRKSAASFDDDSGSRPDILGPSSQKKA